jgi:hypothetical protein
MDDNNLGSPVPPRPLPALCGDFAPVNAPIFSGRIVPDPKWVAQLKRRQEAILQLSRGLRAYLSAMTLRGVDDICAAIEFLLGNEIAEQLENLATIQAQPVPPPTLEQLERAQCAVEQCQGLLDALGNLADSLPDASAEFIVNSQRPMLEENLARAQAWLSEIQRAMESSA